MYSKRTTFHITLEVRKNKGAAWFKKTNDVGFFCSSQEMLNYSLKPSYEYQVRVFGTGVVTRTTELLVLWLQSSLMVAGSQAITSDFEFYVTGKPLRCFHIVKVIFMGSNIHCCLLKWIARSRLSDGKERTRWWAQMKKRKRRGDWGIAPVFPRFFASSNFCVLCTGTSYPANRQHNRDVHWLSWFFCLVS